jgi:hypothetical protein
LDKLGLGYGRFWIDAYISSFVKVLPPQLMAAGIVALDSRWWVEASAIGNAEDTVQRTSGIV